MVLYSEKDLIREMNYYDIPCHEDLKRFFSNKENIHERIMGIHFGIEKEIEKTLYALKFKDIENDLENNIKDFGFVLMKHLDRFYLKKDIEASDLLGIEPSLRIVPFAEFYDGDLLCFYFKNKNERPQIIIWNNEDSEIDDAVIELIAHNLDDLIKK